MQSWAGGIVGVLYERGWINMTNCTYNGSIISDFDASGFISYVN